MVALVGLIMFAVAWGFKYESIPEGFMVMGAALVIAAYLEIIIDVINKHSDP